MHLADIALFDKTFNLNVKPIFLSVQALVPYWLEQTFDDPPVVINICSTGAIRPRPGIAFYNSSKGLLDIFINLRMLTCVCQVRCWSRRNAWLLSTRRTFDALLVRLLWLQPLCEHLNDQCMIKTDSNCGIQAGESHGRGRRYA